MDGLMSDDTFIREVNEDLRQDKAKAFWDRFGPLLIGLAVLLVLATAGFVAWEYFRSNRAGDAGEAFAQAVKLAEAGQGDEALAAFKAIEDKGHGAYPVLSRLRAGSVLAAKGDAAAAVASFDAIAADSAADPALRDIARVRAAYVLVDSGSYGDVQQRASQLAADSNPMRHGAREALGLAAWKDGKPEDATKFFEQIAADPAASQNLKQRANMMLALIRGGATGP